MEQEFRTQINDGIDELLKTNIDSLSDEDLDTDFYRAVLHNIDKLNDIKLKREKAEQEVKAREEELRKAKEAEDAKFWGGILTGAIGFLGIVAGAVITGMYNNHRNNRIIEAEDERFEKGLEFENEGVYKSKTLMNEMNKQGKR